ncbi:MAG: T9SS type A sorting domain-containing protein [Ignavibacteria bacterium]|nr:T9SS type A sorting domain-containing protein [Ignavibacteria bacterium]
MYSTSGGAFWNYAEIGVFGIANSIGFRTETEVWSGLGIVDSLLFSTNSGNNWTLIGTPDGVKINDLVFINETNGWAVGKDGAILKFNADLINISVEYNYLPESISLYQNYPNPFNPYTVIRYSLRENSFITLKVFDTNGKEIITLVNEKQTDGNYEVLFDGSGLSSGIYFYRISVYDENTNREYFESKKMILLK